MVHGRVVGMNDQVVEIIEVLGSDGTPLTACGRRTDTSRSCLPVPTPSWSTGAPLKRAELGRYGGEVPRTGHRCHHGDLRAVLAAGCARPHPRDSRFRARHSTCSVVPATAGPTSVERWDTAKTTASSTVAVSPMMSLCGYFITR